MKWDSSLRLQLWQTTSQRLSLDSGTVVRFASLNRLWVPGRSTRRYCATSHKTGSCRLLALNVIHITQARCARTLGRHRSEGVKGRLYGADTPRSTSLAQSDPD